MVTILGIFTFFLTLSCADLRWEEFPYNINKLNYLGLCEEKLKNSTYQGRCSFLNSNLLGISSLKLKYFSKRCTWWSLGKTKYVICIEFYERWWPTCSFFYMDFQCTKYSKWSILHLLYWEINKCTVTKPAEWSRGFWVKTCQYYVHFGTFFKAFSKLNQGSKLSPTSCFLLFFLRLVWLISDLLTLICRVLSSHLV